MKKSILMRCAIFMCLLGTLTPCAQAQSLDPIDALFGLNVMVWRLLGIRIKPSSHKNKKTSDQRFRVIRPEEKKEKNKSKRSDEDFNFYEHGFESNQKEEKAQKEEPQKVTFEDVAGLEHILAEVREVVDYIKNPEKYHAMGAQVPTGILFEGPPGVGKTLIAKAIANESGCNFFYASGSEFVEMYVGVGASRVRELFAKAREDRPAIIFIDEIDALGATRSKSSSGGGREYDQTLNQLLVEMQGFEGLDNVAIIAATNRADMLDTALKRPGRFTKILSIDLPDAKARTKILEHYIDKKPRVDRKSIDIAELVIKTQGFSGAELEELVNQAAVIAVRRKASNIDKCHIDAALKQSLETRHTRK